MCMRGTFDDLHPLQSEAHGGLGARAGEGRFLFCSFCSALVGLQVRSCELHYCRTASTRRRGCTSVVAKSPESHEACRHAPKRKQQHEPLLPSPCLSTPTRRSA